MFGRRRTTVRARTSNGTRTGASAATLARAIVAKTSVSETSRAPVRYCRLAMFVSDLRHFLDMPEDAPDPAVQMGEQLCAVVRAATARPAGTVWTTALPCRRRPGRRPCSGRKTIFRADLPAPIEWRCSSCGDEGVISGWEGSYCDLRQPRPQARGQDKGEVLISGEMAASLRGLGLLDTDCERLVFAARAGPGAWARSWTPTRRTWTSCSVLWLLRPTMR